MNGGSQPLVSIVTPVYNDAAYLAECIESVLAQRHENWDYTIVDNCSSDGSAEIADRYAARDSRIRVVRNREFLAAIPNHNNAVRRISPASKYCKVVLADDWIFPECLERMVSLAERYPSVGVVGAYALEGENVICTGLPYSSGFLSGREVCRKHLLGGVYVFGSATSLLYRSDLVRSHDPLYNENNIHADTEACFQLLKYSDFGFVHQVLTYTRVRPQSLTALSRNLHTEYAGMLQILVAHGAEYLSPDEYRACFERHIDGYYEFLGKSWLRRRRDADFWAYHRRKMAAAGVHITRGRLALSVLANLVNASLDVRSTLGKLRRGGRAGSKAAGAAATVRLGEIR